MSSDTTWYQEGAKIQNEFQFAANHLTTIESDFEQCYDGEDKDKRIRIKGGGLQHQWQIVPRLTLTGGLRYEDSQHMGEQLGYYRKTSMDRTAMG